jgi:hypothetical protein
MARHLFESLCFSSSQEEELLGVEDLYSFYSSLYLSDLQFWTDEEMCMRQKYVSHILVNNSNLKGCKKMKDQSFNMMRIAKISFLAFKRKHQQMVEEKGITNVVCYDILALPRYRELL